MRCCLCLLMMLGLSLPAMAQDEKEDIQEPEGKVRLTLQTGGHTSIIAKVLWMPDSSQIVTVAHDQTIRVWDVETGEAVNVLYPPLLMQPYTARLSPDGRWLAVSRGVADKGKTSYSIVLIALAEGRIERVLTGPPTGSFLTFSADGKRLASVCSSNKTVYVWNLEKPGAEPEKSFATPGAARGLAFSPDGKHLVQCGEWTGILDVEAGKASRKLFDGAGGDRVAWSPDGKTIAFSTKSGVQLWDPDGKKPRLALEDQIRMSSVSFGTNPNVVLASEYLPPAGSERARTFLFGVGGGKARKTFVGEPRGGKKPAPGAKPPMPDPAHPVDEAVHDSALSPDGQLAAAVGRLGGHQEVLVWRVSDAKLVQRFSSRAFYSVPDGPIGWSPDGRAVIWNQGPGARGFQLEDAPKAEAKPAAPGKPAPGKPAPGGKPAPEDRPAPEALHFLGKAPPAPAPGVVTEQGGMKFVVPNGENTFSITRGNQGKPVVVDLKRQMWHATFFGKGEVAVHGHPLQMIDANTGKVVRSLKGHASYVLNMAVSPNHQYLASTSWDQVVRVHALGQVEPLLSLYVVGKDWVVWTPEGYYAASPAGERLMGWVVEGSPDKMATFHPAAHFRSRLYRPDVIRLLLKEGSVAKALKTADDARGIASKEVTAVTDVLPPNVTVDVSPPKAGKVVITAKASPDPESKGGEPVTGLQLLIDDRPWNGKPDKEGAGANKSYEATWTVPLSAGKHQVRALARTASSLGTSRDLVREVEPGAAAPKPDPKLYVLAIGINGYKKVTPLGAAVKDATELEKTLKKWSAEPLFGNKYEAKLITDDTQKGVIDKKAMLAGFDWLKERQTSADVAVIFYAGHGALLDKEFYLVAQDSSISDLAQTGLSRTELKQRMQGLPGKVLVVLDACHSGGVGLLFDDVSRDLSDEDCGVVTICAAKPSETAQEKGDHGYLTKSVMEALEGKASVSPRDKQVHVHHIQQYIIDRVEELSDDKQHTTVIVPPWLRSFGVSKPDKSAAKP